MSTEAFDFNACIESAQNAIDRETIAHNKRMEFWHGYKCAMEEARDHLPIKVGGTLT